MKILILNYFDIFGGASIAASRLFLYLKKNKIDVTYGVVKKNLNIAKIIYLNEYKSKNIFMKIINRTRNKLFIFSTTNPIHHSENKKSLLDINYINNSDYDLIHLHWINNDMISIEDIAKIKKPIVWTMHDSWPFCGAEHHPNILENDTRYIEGYYKKNKPKTTVGQDICRKTWERKKKYWKNVKFNFLCPSNYMKDAFYNSALFKNTNNACTVIPNIVPSDTFKPLNKSYLREIYNIPPPPTKKVIGFGAAYDITEKINIKGGYLLCQALKFIKNTQDYHLVIFGNASSDFIKEINIPLFETGFISNEIILASIYNLCDVVVCPSLLESFGLVCLEASFCGVPVAAFNTGGIPDIIEHKKTGYLAKCFDPEDLYNGMMYCIENYNELSNNSIIKAKKDFDNEVIVNKHIDLYKSVLGSKLTSN